MIVPSPDGKTKRRIYIEGVTVAMAFSFVTAMTALTFVFVLAIRHDLDAQSVTALFGGLIGHVLGVASQRRTSGSRSTDGDT
jgi:hypothetical protein